MSKNPQGWGLPVASTRQRDHAPADSPASQTRSMMTTTTEPVWALAATNENAAMGLQLGRCLIIESTVPGHLAELFWWSDDTDRIEDLEIGWEAARDQMFEDAVGGPVAMGERWHAWHQDRGLVP
jgi:hypothetical protein